MSDSRTQKHFRNDQETVWPVYVTKKVEEPPHERCRAYNTHIHISQNAQCWGSRTKATDNQRWYKLFATYVNFREIFHSTVRWQTATNRQLHANNNTEFESERGKNERIEMLTFSWSCRSVACSLSLPSLSPSMRMLIRWIIHIVSCIYQIRIPDFEWHILVTKAECSLLNLIRLWYYFSSDTGTNEGSKWLRTFDEIEQTFQCVLLVMQSIKQK